jgi:hypothetical protein
MPTNNVNGGINMETGNQILEYPFHSYREWVKDSGFYYLSPQICKDIIIAVGVKGLYMPKAIKKVLKNINYIGDVMENVIPVFRGIDRKVIIYYGGELAECLVEAAETGKGVEIAIGYPKVLVYKVN